jgi:hypothetical protein
MTPSRSGDYEDEQTAPRLRFDDFAAALAGSADADTPGRGAHLGVYRSQIYVPTPLGDVMGVADIIPELRPLAADLTYLCH